MNCPCILKSGANKGKRCGKSVKEGRTCGIHRNNCNLGEEIPKKGSPSEKGPCDLGYEISAKTGKCVKNCKPGTVRNVKTNRCKRAGSRSPRQYVEEEKRRSPAPRRTPWVPTREERAVWGEGLDSRVLDFLNTMIVEGDINSITHGEIKKQLKQMFGLRSADYRKYRDYVADLTDWKKTLLESKVCMKCTRRLDALRNWK